ACAAPTTDTASATAAGAGPATAVIVERVAQPFEDLAEDSATYHPADAAATAVAVRAAPDGAAPETAGAERWVTAWRVVASLLLQHTPEPIGGHGAPQELGEDGAEDVVVGEGGTRGVVVALGELTPYLLELTQPFTVGCGYRLQFLGGLAEPLAGHGQVEQACHDHIVIR